MRHYVNERLSCFNAQVLYATYCSAARHIQIPLMARGQRQRQEKMANFSGSDKQPEALWRVNEISDRCFLHRAPSTSTRKIRGE